MTRTSLSAFAFLVALTVLTGCGIKPDFVDPPQGHAKDTFPQTYPDPETVVK